MRSERTKERQYQALVDLRSAHGLTRLGLRASAMWHEDPKLLLFSLSRCKFVAKMLSGKQYVLDVGCGDAFGSRIVLQEVGGLCAVDFDAVFVQDVRERMDEKWKFECRVHDILSGPVRGSFDAAYSLDVIEHIPKKKEHVFMANVVASLKKSSVFIIGTPSLQSQAHASELSKEGHVNCKDHKELKALMGAYFQEVFLFSMNDEVVHTGFYPMAHYLFAVGIGKRRT